MTDSRQSGDRNFGRLFVQHEARIYGYIRSLVVHRTDAEDLLQETASVLWQKFPEFQAGSNFLAWAMSVARFQVQRFRRDQKHNVLHFSEAFHDLLAADTVAESARLGDLQQLLDECMHKLPPADRELFVIHYASEATTASLADQLGRPASTVYNAIRRVRRAFGRLCETGAGQGGPAMTTKPQSLELDELVNAQCEGVLTDEKAARLEALVAGDAELRRDYIIYLHVHACAERGQRIARDRLESQAPAADMEDQLPFISHAPVPPGFLLSTSPGTVGYSVQSWSVAYLIATALFGLACW